MSHEVIMFLPEVNRESSFVLFLHVGDTGDVEQNLTELVLVNKRNTPITVLTDRYTDRQVQTDRETDRYRDRQAMTP